MTASALLGGLAPDVFLRRHWQKEPLLVRQAVPGFQGFLDAKDLARLARQDAAPARLVVRRGKQWQVHEAPFDVDLGALPPRDWTILVQGVEGIVPGGWELLRRFSFMPMARIDDLMVSWAAPGGGVGAHVDQYDVFLLQGRGRRRWRISRQADLALTEGQPLKLLRRFVPDAEYVLEPGDMLYLPPGVAHEGTALTECTTYSIGFLAPSHEALVQEMLAYLAMTTPQEGLYEDPDALPAGTPAELGDAMVARVDRVLAPLRFDLARTGEFLGRMLTGPKPFARFVPRRPPPLAEVARLLKAPGRLALALPSRMLYRGGQVFLNGEVHDVTGASAAALRTLADERALALPAELGPETAALVHAWWRAGWVELGGPPGPPQRRRGA